MTTLIKDGQAATDIYLRIDGDDPIPDGGALLVSLPVWQDHWQRLTRRPDPIGVVLASHEHPEVIADDLENFAVIALEFPTFRDGRAYSYARLLRDRYGFSGELRAIGDVLLEQLHYMERVGFNAFELAGDDPLAELETARGDFSVWYQGAVDGRRPASVLRQARTSASK